MDPPIRLGGDLFQYSESTLSTKGIWVSCPYRKRDFYFPLSLLRLVCPEKGQLPLFEEGQIMVIYYEKNGTV